MDIIKAKELLSKCTNADEWNAACDQIKRSNNGAYPEEWYAQVILSGFMDSVLGSGSSQIRIISG